MPARLRLQRKGKKRAPHYHIVAADSRTTRDGKYIERLGHYNPNVNPADITIDREKALEWIKNGAQPTDTMRAILKYTGVMYQLHLEGGVKKGALTQEQADAKLTAWLEEKASKVSTKRNKLSTDKDAKTKAALEAEIKVKEERAAKIFAKTSALAAAVEAETTAAIAKETEATTENIEVVAAESSQEVSATEASQEIPAAEAVQEVPAAEETPESPAVDETKPIEGSEPASEEPKGE